MATVALAFPNRLDEATIAGQNWSTARPLAWVQSRQLAKAARAPTRTPRFFLKFASAIECGVAALLAHNFSTTATWRLRGYSADPRPPVDAYTTQAATLDLDFVDASDIMSQLVCTRGSDGWWFDSAGVARKALSNVARLTWELGTGKALGLLVEGSASNNVLWSRDLTNAAWSATSMTRAQTATGADAVSNSATRLTATGATARVFQATSTAAGGTTFSIMLRRVSGSGAVKITANNFSANTTVTLTSTWQRFEITGLASPTVGIQIDTSGDVIEADFAQVELGGSSSSPIVTTSSGSARAADNMTMTIAVPLGTGAWVWAGRMGKFAAGMPLMRAEASGTHYSELSLASSAQVDAKYNNGGSVGTTSMTGLSLAPNADLSAGASYANTSHRVAVNGALSGSTGSGGTTVANAVTLRFQPSTDSAFTVARITFFAAVPATADLTAMTAAFSAPAAGYDSGSVAAWPAAWVSGTTPEQQASARGVAQILPATPQTFAYWRVDISDPSNTTWPQVGRMHIGRRWQPVVGLRPGSSLGFEERDTSIETPSGAEFFATFPLRRTARFSLEYQTEDEAMAKSLEMQQEIGTSGEVLFAWNPDDTLYQPRRTFVAKLQQLGQVTCLGPDNWNCSYQLRELL